MLVRAAVVVLVAAVGAPAFADQSAPPSVFERVWRLTEWYSNEHNPYIEQVLFSGRYQHDFVVEDAREGQLNESNVRRMRVGTRVTFLRSYVLHVEADLNPQERDPFYTRLTDAYVQWRRGDRVVVTAGKQGIPFTSDGGTSSKELLAIDRSNLANNLWFPQEYLPGVSVSGRSGPWHYRSGAYSAGAGNREFGRFSGGVVALASVGHEFAKKLHVKSALVTGSYVYQRPDLDNTFTRALDHIASANVALEKGRWGVRADFTGASGYQRQSAAWGATVMPFVSVTSKLQLVGRYTWLESADVNGLELATYERRLVRGRGDRYREGYLGANYYLYGHRLKLQSGVQTARMRDEAADGGAYSGTTWTTGLRIGW